jgi:uncharacterized membrane protein
MNKGASISSKFGVRQITVVGMLSAVSIILGLTGYGFIPLPTVKATIMHVPVIIGAILEGPAVGMMIGLIFGIFSIIQNMAAPNIMSFAIINPLVSVLPRVLIGITAYYSYKLMPGKNNALKIGAGAAVGSLTNTIGFLTMLYFLYAASFAQAKGISLDATASVIYGIAITNGIPEAIISVLITTPVILAFKRRLK